MKGSQIHRPKGFAAVTVLVISLLGGLIVFDTVQENINQERMAGNYAKELNAHLQAENGLAASYNAMSADSDLDSEIMMSDLTAIQNNKQDDPDAYRYSLEPWVTSTLTETSSASTSNTSNAILIESKGSHYEGNYVMHGTMELGASGSTSVYTGPITTCDGATLAGIAIDSYDSSRAYDANSNSGNNGDVLTINANADLSLSGDTPIKGDVSVNGKLDIAGSGSITGDTFASGDINMKANGGNGSIYGDVSSGGTITTSSSVANSNSFEANGDVLISDAYNGPVTYQGSTDPDPALVPNAVKDSSSEPLVADKIFGDCDVLNLASEFNHGDQSVTDVEKLQEDIDSGLISIESLPFDYSSGTTDVTLEAVDNSDQLSINGGTNIDPVTIEFLGETTPVYVLDLNTLFGNGFTLTIASDVTIYAPATSSNQNWSTSDIFIQGSIEIKNNASLTIITDSSLNIKGSVTGLDEYGDPATSVVNSENDNYFNLYSGYDEGTGLTLSNSGSSYMTAYAPEADILMNGGGTLFGSVLGKTLDVSNGAGIHYDEKLSGSNTGDTGSGDPSGVVITRWF